MHQHESRLDKARRQVAEAQARVNAQTSIVKALTHSGCYTDRAESRLAELSNALELEWLNLASEQKLASASR